MRRVEEKEDSKRRFGVASIRRQRSAFQASQLVRFQLVVRPRWFWANAPPTGESLRQGPFETHERVVYYRGCWVGTPQRYCDRLSKTLVLWKKSQTSADASNEPGTLTGFDQWWVGSVVSQETTASGGEEPDAP